MNAKEALSLLRNNPHDVCLNNGFLTESDKVLASTGGPCSISCSQVDDHVFRLEAKLGGSDYFFPYLPGRCGHYDVPRTTPVGTIVLTGGMNGCSLQVDRVGTSSFRFIHDADGKYALPGPTTICRVNYRDYAGPSTSRGIGLGISFALSKVPSMGLMPYPRNTILCVKGRDSWKVYSSGIMFHYTDQGRKKTKHFPFQSSLSPCITSFDH